MKKYKVIICIPTFVGIKAELADQFIQLGGYAKEKGYPVITIPNKTHVDARNWLATGGGGFQNSKMLINMTECLIWIDSDTVFSLDQLEQLIKHEHPFVSAVYYTQRKSNDKMVVAANWDESKFLKTGRMEYLTEQNIKDARKQPIQVSYVGFGFCKTNTSIFEKMSYPYFTNKIVTIQNKDVSYTENVSEDASFCLDSSVKPIVDTTLIVGHLKSGVV